MGVYSLHLRQQQTWRHAVRDLRDRATAFSMHSRGLIARTPFTVYGSMASTCAMPQQAYTAVFRLPLP